METWHNRLQLALSERGKTWKELFAYLNEKTGITKPSVYAWKPDHSKRSAMLGADYSALVCKWLAINPMWLFHNKGDSGLDRRELSEDAIKIAESVNQLSSEYQQRLLELLKKELETKHLEAELFLGDPNIRRLPSDDDAIKNSKAGNS